MKNKVLIFVVLFLLLFTSTSFASWDKKPEFRWMQLYRYDLRYKNNGVRQKNHEFYINRISAAFVYKNKQGEVLFKLEPFSELHRSTDEHLFVRKELGVEIGRDIFPWVYIGEGIQRIWFKDDYRYYKKYERRDQTESETRLLLTHNLLSAKYIELKGFVLDEYTYDFDRGTGIRNELTIGLTLPVNKYIETAIDWRHIDRIRYYDSDTLEASATLIF